MTTLTFQTTALSVINQQNQIFFTTLDIAKALGYSNGDIGVKNLYNRHSDEFTPNMTALIDMQTNGGMQKVRIFSLRGAHLIGMLSHTKVAKDFRRWVLDILDKEVGQTEKTQTTVDDRTGLRNAVNMLVSKKGLIYSDAYNIVHQYMNVDSIEDINKADLPKAVAYVHKLVLEGELIDKPTALLPEPKADVVEIPRKVAQALVKFHRLTIRNSEKAEKGLRAIHEAMGYERYQRNNLAAGLFDLHHEFNYWIDEFERATTQPQTPQLRYINA